MYLRFSTTNTDTTEMSLVSNTELHVAYKGENDINVFRNFWEVVSKNRWFLKVCRVNGVSNFV
jgi:hypothetical protein